MTRDQRRELIVTAYRAHLAGQISFDKYESIMKGAWQRYWKAKGYRN